MTEKPVFWFCKLFKCQACTLFEGHLFSRLLQDPVVRQAVVLEQVTFGQNSETGETYHLESEFPDFASKISYAPYLWLAKPYDESQGYHLNPSTMNNKTLNTRLQGKEYVYGPTSTYEELRNWLLTNARSLSSNASTFHGRKPQYSR